MRTRSALRRIGIATLVFSIIALSAGGITGTVAAQDCNMESPDSMDCDNPSLNPFQGVLDNIFDLAQALLQYSGFVTAFAGVTLWFGTGNNSDRTQLGMWLTAGGMCMIVLFFGFSAIVDVLKFIGTGS